MSIASYFESGETTQDKGHVKNLVLLALADGHINDEELILIHKIGRHIGLTYAQTGEIIDNPNGYPVIPPASKIERLEHMIDMVNLIQIDGIIDENEMKLISRFSVQIGFNSVSDAHVGEILDGLNAGKSTDEIVESIV
jgi:uncharacterized membrane protein YebE (DUF533 family)